MATAKTVPGRCEHCGAMFEVPAETIGLETQCPHCRRQTEVLLAVGVVDGAASRKAMIWAVVGVLVLAALLAAGFFALHMARRLKEKRSMPRQGVELRWIRSQG